MRLFMPRIPEKPIQGTAHLPTDQATGGQPQSQHPVTGVAKIALEKQQRPPPKARSFKILLGDLIKKITNAFHEFMKDVTYYKKLAKDAANKTNEVNAKIKELEENPKMPDEALSWEELDSELDQLKSERFSTYNAMTQLEKDIDDDKDYARRPHESDISYQSRLKPRLEVQPPGKYRTKFETYLQMNELLLKQFELVDAKDNQIDKRKIFDIFCLHSEACKQEKKENQNETPEAFEERIRTRMGQIEDAFARHGIFTAQFSKQNIFIADFIKSYEFPDDVKDFIKACKLVYVKDQGEEIGKQIQGANKPDLKNMRERLIDLTFDATSVKNPALPWSDEMNQRADKISANLAAYIEQVEARIDEGKSKYYVDSDSSDWT